MAMLIDDSGARRVAGGVVPPQPQQERDRFRVAVRQALLERATATDDERLKTSQPQERMVVVEKGDHLEGIAEAHDVDVEDVEYFNPQLEDPDHIEVGEVLFLPPPSPGELATHPDGVALFRDDLYQRGNAVEYSDAGEIDHDVEIEGLTADVGEFLDALPPEQRDTAAQQLFDEDWTDAGPAQMAVEAAAERCGITLEESSHAGPEVEQAARQILVDVGNHAEPDEALAALDEAYGTATPEVKRALLQAPGTQEVIDAAAAHAISALSEPLDGAVGQSAEELQMAQRINDMSMTLAPEIRTALFESFVPALQQAQYHASQTDEPMMIGTEGTRLMFDAIERLDPERDKSSIEGLAEVGIYHMNVIPPELGHGGLLAYFMSLASNSGSSSGDNIVLKQDLMPRLEQYDQEVGNRIETYETTLLELSWRAQNGGSVMTEDQLDKAIDEYTADNSAWANDLEEQRQAIAQDGERYLEELALLESYYPKLFEEDGGSLSDRVKQLDNTADEEIAARFIEHLDNPNATTAMRMAIEEKPELLNDPVSMRLIGQYGKITDRGRKLAEELTTLFIQHEIAPTMTGLDVNDPASRQALFDKLDKLKNSPFRSLIGVKEGTLDEALKAVKATIPESGTISPKDLKGKLAEMDKKLSGIRGFEAGSAGGHALRYIGALSATAGLVNSLTVAQGDPVYYGKAFLETAGLVQKGVEIGGVYTDAIKNSELYDKIGSSRKPAVKALGAVTSLFDLYTASTYLTPENKDYGAAALYTASAGGGFMAAVGTGTWAGPVGLGISLIATAGIIQYDRVKKSNHFDNDATAKFFENAGFDTDVAKALSDQSGDGYNVLPLLARYAEAQDLNLADPTDQAQFANWLNTMAPESLAALRDNLHHVLDEKNNDVESFPAEDEESDRIFRENLDDLLYSTKPVIEDGKGHPRSFAQLDMTLEVLGIQPLA
ncbi:LysM peptidoglycan-binding domain-containing protein [Pseudomonas matsuisoli]|uniref:Peptidoglycan-binding protein LysM n=1 Tax=Pseudomonas matsuisoli TaxID=1515666 RepID=A0A917PN72_9PSED|nr:LysM domain-containing protein [Pseudomonas matsuisoli]GGJ85915.1 peptidoglycan-binding protein LysM [Pseudomonas matsuisoli]